MTTGFCASEVDGVPPGNTHCQLVGDPVVRSVKLTLPPTQTVVGLPEKLAAGGGGHALTVTYPVIVFVSFPYAFVTVRVTA